MANASIEKRLKTLEAEVAELKQKLAATPSPTSRWWENVVGAFANDPAYEEAMRLGREWRERENAKSLAKKKPRKRNKNVRP